MTGHVLGVGGLSAGCYFSSSNTYPGENVIVFRILTKNGHIYSRDFSWLQFLMLVMMSEGGGMCVMLVLTNFFF
jgi:hypothetical protein